MTINDILTYLKGSVTVEARGDFLERFLNICMRRGIYLSDVKRLSSDKIRAKIGIQGFRQIRPIAKKTRTRVRIEARSGMPFLLHRFRKRKAIIVGFAVFFGIMWYLSTHIMGIDITGNQRIPTADIERELKEFGIYRGAAASSVEPRSVQNRMMTSFDDIAWIGVNIKGSKAYIEVKERLDTRKTVDRDIPCNLVALRDGLVSGLEVRSGQTAVRLGEMVEKGDLLVSGVLDSQVEGIRYAHSDGKVFADTSYKKVREYPLEYTEKVYTGEQKTKRRITVFGKTINLFLNDRQPFEICEKEVSRRLFHLLSKKSTGIEVETEVYKEYSPKKVRRTAKQAAESGMAELCGELEREIGGEVEILDKKVTYRQIENKVVEVTAEYFCREDIATQSLIDKTQNLDYNYNQENVN